MVMILVVGLKCHLVVRPGPTATTFFSFGRFLFEIFQAPSMICLSPCMGQRRHGSLKQVESKGGAMSVSLCGECICSGSGIISLFKLSRVNFCVALICCFATIERTKKPGCSLACGCCFQFRLTGYGVPCQSHMWSSEHSTFQSPKAFQSNTLLLKCLAPQVAPSEIASDEIRCCDFVALCNFVRKP